MALIFVLSSQTTLPTPAEVSDKYLHLTEYALLGVLVFRALSRGLPARATVRTAALTFLITTAYGVTDEFHQSFVEGRISDVRDVYADAAGAAIAILLCGAWGIIASPGFRVPTSRSLR
jgi:VanZ family protein